MCIWQFQYRLRTLNSIVPTKLTNKTGINEFRRGPACIFQSTWEYYGIFIGLPMAPNYGMSFIRRKKTKWRTAHRGVTCPTPADLFPGFATTSSPSKVSKIDRNVHIPLQVFVPSWKRLNLAIFLLQREEAACSFEILQKFMMLHLEIMLE